jgi:hypothetical protein
VSRPRARSILVVGLALGALVLAWQIASRRSTRATAKPAPPREPIELTIDYTAEGSIFPPEFPAPTWLWRDADAEVASRDIDVTFADGTPPLRARSAGEGMRLGESDPRPIGLRTQETSMLPRSPRCPRRQSFRPSRWCRPSRASFPGPKLFL